MIYSFVVVNEVAMTFFFRAAVKLNDMGCGFTSDFSS